MDDYGGSDYQNVESAPAEAAPTETTAAPSDYSTNDNISSDVASNVMESLGVAGVDVNKWNLAPAPTNQTQPTTGDFARADRALPTGQQEASAAEKFEKFLSGVGDFANKYKTPLEMIGRGIQNASKVKTEQAAAQALSDARIRELNAADELKRNAAARYSASVAGLRAPGLINQSKLQRIGGAQVFNENGQLNRA